MSEQVIVSQDKDATISLWQKILLRSIGFGAGFAVTIGLIAVVFVWHTSRPRPAVPWNQKAITAQFDGLYAEIGDRVVANFRYTVLNNTEKDYYFPANKEDVFKVLAKGQGLSHDDTLKWDAGIYIPVRQKVNVSFKLDFDYTQEYPMEERDNKEKLNKFIKRQAEGLDGFVILDPVNRYEIRFPGGWQGLDK
ncbi:MAG TPA: hypothetical protein VI584_05150 [Nitrospiria bacterium]|nr:hypothetical protein [Nitrospiria bacterium]